MRSVPKHPSCDQAILDRAREQAKLQRCREIPCTACGTDGVRRTSHASGPEIEDPCDNCKGFGSLWDEDGAVPKWDAVEMTERYDQKLGWKS
jgi:hypothetical protein